MRKMTVSAYRSWNSGVSCARERAAVTLASPDAAWMESCCADGLASKHEGCLRPWHGLSTCMPIAGCRNARLLRAPVPPLARVAAVLSGPWVTRSSTGPATQAASCRGPRPTDLQELEPRVAEQDARQHGLQVRLRHPLALVLAQDLKHAHDGLGLRAGRARPCQQARLELPLPEPRSARTQRVCTHRSLPTLLVSCARAVSNSGQARPKRGRGPARLRDLPLRQPGARGAVRHGRLARRDQLVEQRVCEHARQLAHLRPTQG